MSSLHLVSSLFQIILSLYGHQSVILLVHLLSFILATCPAHLHFCFLTTCTMYFTLVLALIHVDLCLSLVVIPNIALYIALSAILSRFPTPGFASVCHSRYYAMNMTIDIWCLLQFKISKCHCHRHVISISSDIDWNFHMQAWMFSYFYAYPLYVVHIFIRLCVYLSTMYQSTFLSLRIPVQAITYTRW